MDRPGMDDDTARTCTCMCAHGGVPPQPGHWTGADRASPAWWRRVLAMATVAAGLMVGLNALVQAVNVLSTWWRHSG